MKIKDIKPNQGKIELEGIITDKSEPREFSSGKVVNAKLKDIDGEEIILVLWNEQIDAVAVGNKIKIENGYAKEWNNQLQLSTGKFGTLTVLEGENQTSEESEIKAEETEEEIEEKEHNPNEELNEEELEDTDFSDLVDVEEDNL